MCIFCMNVPSAFCPQFSEWSSHNHITIYFQYLSAPLSSLSEQSHVSEYLMSILGGFQSNASYSALSKMESIGFQPKALCTLLLFLPCLFSPLPSLFFLLPSSESSILFISSLSLKISRAATLFLLLKLPRS